MNGKYQLNNEDYHAADGISASGLKFLAESALHYDNRALFAKESAAMAFGTAFHCAVLEPELFADEYLVAPEFNKRSNQGKEDHAAFHAENGHKRIIAKADYDAIQAMARNVNAIAGNLLHGGETEQSYFYDADGITLKCRPDYYRRDLGVVVDIKTSAKIGEFDLRKTITDYRYHWQAAHYLRTLRLLDHPAESFAFIFCETVEPYMVKVRVIDWQSLAEAEVEVADMIEQYRHYRLTGKATFFKTIQPFGSN